MNVLALGGVADLGTVGQVQNTKTREHNKLTDYATPPSKRS